MRFVRFVFPVLALLLITASFTPPQAVAQQYGVLHIDKAIYGKNGQGDDVTMRLRRMVQNNTLDIKVNNDNMGGDPNKGADKSVKVQYTYLGRSQTVVVKEGDRLKLP